MLKSIIIKFVGVLFMGITLMNLFACSTIKTDVVEETKKQLQQKYNAEFSITSIGNRINTGSATMYAYRVGYEDELFKVVYSHETDRIEDDYVKSKISYEIAVDFTALCQENNIDICSSVLLTSDESSSEIDFNIKVSDFLSQYNVSIITIRVGADISDMTVDKCEKFLNAISQLSSKYNKKINVIFYPMNSENYLEYSKEIKDIASPSTKWFMDFSQNRKIIISAENNSTTIDANELEASIKGE